MRLCIHDTIEKSPCLLHASQVINEEVPLLTSTDFSPEFRDFIRLCLHKDPLKRHAAEQLLDHPFIKRVRVSSQS